MDNLIDSIIDLLGKVVDWLIVRVLLLAVLVFILWFVFTKVIQ